MGKLNWIFKSQNVLLAKLKELVRYVYFPIVFLIHPPMFLAAQYSFRKGKTKPDLHRDGESAVAQEADHK